MYSPLGNGGQRHGNKTASIRHHELKILQAEVYGDEGYDDDRLCGRLRSCASHKGKPHDPSTNWKLNLPMRFPRLEKFSRRKLTKRSTGSFVTCKPGWMSCGRRWPKFSVNWTRHPRGEAGQCRFYREYATKLSPQGGSAAAMRGPMSAREQAAAQGSSGVGPEGRHFPGWSN